MRQVLTVYSNLSLDRAVEKGYQQVQVDQEVGEKDPSFQAKYLYHTEGHFEGPTKGPFEGPIEGPTEGPIEGPTEGPIEGPTNNLENNLLVHQSDPFWRRAFLTCDLYPLVLIIVASFQYPMFFLTNFMTFATHYQFSSQFAAKVASYAAIFMILGKLMMGPIYDFVGYRWSLYLVLTVQMLFIAFTYFFGSSEWAFPIVLFPAFWLNGAHMNSYMVMSQRLFGVNQGPKAYAIMSFGLTIANLLGSSGANVLLSIFGFKNIFLYFFFSCLLSLIVFCIYRPTLEQKEGQEVQYDPSKV
jgi:predicted MFS family arabinose efflux permease